MTGPVVASMSRPPFYAPRPATVEVCETHVSIVFLAGEFAYKVKKPVRMPFLDYSTLERRRAFCEAEVRLNRRFAPDVYLGVRAIAERDGELMIVDADDPHAVEYAVLMRRFDQEATLERLVQRGVVDKQLAERVGAHVAEMHLGAPPAPSGCWEPAYVAERVEENLDSVRADTGVLVDASTVKAVRRFSHAFLRAHEGLLWSRIAAGRVRDVHGDLRAQHVLIEAGGISLVDCVEFDERLRRIDVAADLAFLTMDLERLGARSAADWVEQAYLARTGDTELHALLPFYACYRAWVRAKVTALRLRQLDVNASARTKLEQQARDLFDLSLRLAWRSRLPLLVVVCGVAGSGKSSLAAALSRQSGLPHLSSDFIRKEMAGLAPAQRGDAQIYTEEMTRATYRELARRATASLGSSGGAVVDATFHRRDVRMLLKPNGARVLWVECTAPRQALRDRVKTRRYGTEHGSDATWPVTAAQLSAWESLDHVPPADRHLLRTDRPLDDCLDELDSFVSAALDSRGSSHRPRPPYALSPR